jgi:hypothetical protein
LTLVGKFIARPEAEKTQGFFPRFLGFLHSHVSKPSYLLFFAKDAKNIISVERGMSTVFD